jgi:ribosome biogenesis GTPase A
MKDSKWFPGHMKNAMTDIEETKIKLADCILYVLDSRAPYACMNPFVDKIVHNKPIIYVLNKIDLSDDEQRADFIAHLKDSAERLKVMSLLLSRQAKELEETGYTSTVCYYPEERDRYDYLKNNKSNE